MDLCTFLFSYLLPVLFLGLTYARPLRYLWRTGDPVAVGSGARRTKGKVTRMIVIVAWPCSSASVGCPTMCLFSAGGSAASRSLVLLNRFLLSGLLCQLLRKPHHLRAGLQALPQDLRVPVGWYSALRLWPHVCCGTGTGHPQWQRLKCESTPK